jgi:hypothetical protein
MRKIKAITQSIIKLALSYYQDNECGAKIEAALNGIQNPPTPAMSLGIMFEYLITGSTGIHDVIPEPVRLKNGDLSAPYRVVTAQAERVKALLKDMNIEILEYNTWHDSKSGSTKIGGHFDVIANVNGEKSIIDIKYSSNVDDKWSNWGWQWNDKQKDYHSIQAAHYSMISGLPFYFLVAESSEDGKIEFFRVDLSKETMDRHKERISLATQMIDATEFGLQVRPEFNKCENCPIKDSCASRAIAPQPKVIPI